MKRLTLAHSFILQGEKANVLVARRSTDRPGTCPNRSGPPHPDRRKIKGLGGWDQKLDVASYGVFPPPSLEPNVAPKRSPKHEQMFKENFDDM